jgi:hypothetical protein
MRANVLTDESLTKHAGQFAWLSVDTDKPENAAFVEKYPIQGWPAFLMIDPETEKVALHWYGSATAPQLGKLFDDGARAIRGGGTPAELALAQADRLSGEKKHAEAAKFYQKAIDLGGPGWPRGPRAVESLTMSYLFARNEADCARVAAHEAPAMPRGQSFANTVSNGFGCAMSKKDAAALKTLQPLAEEAARSKDVLADDRSGLYQLLVERREEEHDAEGAKKLAGEWLAFLEAEAAKAPNAEARAAFDSHRIAAAAKAGDMTRVIPALEASERDLPEDYNPPNRLAGIYTRLGRLDDALAANGRALAKSYGARKLMIFQSRAAILEKKEDSAGARKTLEEAIRFSATLPAGPSLSARVEELKKDLKRLE